MTPSGLWKSRSKTTRGPQSDSNAFETLLNALTHLPPEILGSIFLSNVIRDGGFSGVMRGSYSFLLVCRHWHEVTLRTPKIWSSWGNTIRDWSKWYVRRSALLELISSEYSNHDFDDALHDLVQDRAARDLIRRVHLKCANPSILNSVISSIITEREETQSNSIESLIVQNRHVLVADLSLLLPVPFTQAEMPPSHRMQHLIPGLDENTNHVSDYPFTRNRRHITHPNRIPLLSITSRGRGLSIWQRPSPSIARRNFASRCAI